MAWEVLAVAVKHTALRAAAHLEEGEPQDGVGHLRMREEDRRGVRPGQGRKRTQAGGTLDRRSATSPALNRRTPRTEENHMLFRWPSARVWYEMSSVAA